MKTKSEIELIKKIEKIGGKWSVCHCGTYDGRKQTYAAIKIGDDYWIGESQCSRKDTWNRKIGRIIALGRAFWKYQIWTGQKTKYSETFYENLQPVRHEMVEVTKEFRERRKPLKESDVFEALRISDKNGTKD